jgi:transcriptional regulator with XRE-family HTH domain
MAGTKMVNMVSQIIEDALQRQGYGSRRALAERCGVAPSSVTKWARGLTPEARRWPIIEDQLGLEPGTLAAAAQGGPIPRPDGERDRWRDELRYALDRQAEFADELAAMSEDGEWSEDLQTLHDHWQGVADHAQRQLDALSQPEPTPEEAAAAAAEQRATLTTLSLAGRLAKLSIDDQLKLADEMHAYLDARGVPAADPLGSIFSSRA